MDKRDGRTKVLFVCIGNSCRSTMAEAIALRDAADTIEAFSGGLAPIGYVAKMTQQTLMRNGYWVEGLESKGISPEMLNQADRVINMSGRPRELAFPDYSKVEDWEVEDPFGKDPKISQQTFEKIWQRVTLLTMRIQFPGPGNYLETSGQIVQRSESEKEPGVRFVDLTAEEQQQIRDRIWAQISEAESHPETEAFQTLLNQQDALGGVDHAAKSFSPEDAVSRATAEPLIQSMDTSLEPQSPRDKIRDVKAKLAASQKKIRDWIWAQISEAESHPETEAFPTLLNQQDALGGVDIHAAKSFSVEDAVPRRTAEQMIESMNASTESLASPDKILDVNTKLTTPKEQPISDDLDRAGIPRSISNRRIHLRKQVVPLGYIGLERSNGGIIRNVSEGGLSLAAAIALPDADLPNMRFQIPYCSGWIEAKGQIAWRSESGKIAGVRFVALSQEARGQIRKWIRSEVSPSRLQEQLEKTRQAQNLRVANLISEFRDRSEVAQEDRSAEPFLPDPASVLGVKVPLAESRVPTAKRVLKVRLGKRNRRRNLGIPGRKWRGISTVAGLIVLIMFTVGWIARNLNAGNKIPVTIVRQTVVASGASKGEMRPLERRITEDPAPHAEKMDLQAQKGESLPAARHQNSDTPPQNSPRQVRRVERSSPPGIVKHPKLPPEKAPAPVQMTKEPTPAVANVKTLPVQTAQTQHVEILPAPPPKLEAKIRPAVSSDPGLPKDASPMEPMKKDSSPPSPKPPESPVNITGLVATRTDPYPSLRIPNERSAKKSSQGKSLQFGHLVSRVEPSYPEEAKQRGIEGTVKLHAVFGRDGTVESLSSISGPPALVAAAMNAVRGWHYSQTLLDNKSVEIEEDIFVEFRLSNSATARN